MMRGKSNKTTISFLLLEKKMTKGEIENDKGEKTRPPTPCPPGLVCHTTAIQQEEELPCSCAQVSGLGAQVRAEAQHQHGVQQDILVEASLQEAHLSMGALSHPGPGFLKFPPGLAAGPSPGTFVHAIHPDGAPFCVI